MNLERQRNIHLVDPEHKRFSTRGLLLTELHYFVLAHSADVGSERQRQRDNKGEE